jgi:hypothetical protein
VQRPYRSARGAPAPDQLPAGAYARRPRPAAAGARGYGQPVLEPPTAPRDGTPRGLSPFNECHVAAAIAKAPPRANIGDFGRRAHARNCVGVNRLPAPAESPPLPPVNRRTAWPRCRLCRIVGRIRLAVLRDSESMAECRIQQDVSGGVKDPLDVLGQRAAPHAPSGNAGCCTSDWVETAARSHLTATRARA